MSKLDRKVFSQLTRQAELYVGAGARRLRTVLRSHLQEFASEIALGRDPQHVIGELTYRHERELRTAKESWILALAVRGYHLAGIYWGRKASVLGFQAKALSVDLFGSDELVARHMMARVGDWVEKTSKLESATSASQLEGLYRAAFGHAGANDSQTPAQLAKTILSEGLAAIESRAEMMSRTMTVWGFNEGAQEMYRSEGVSQKEWLTTEDDVTCEECAAMDGVTCDVEGGFAEGIDHPPLHPNCLPGDALISSRSRITGVSKRWYKGDLIILRCASGNELSCTPNHPVLTDRGWIPANLVYVGSNVIRCGVGDGETFGTGNDENVPSRIEDVAESFLLSRQVFSMPVPVSSVDFHGDGGGSEVAIIGAYGLLGDDIDSTLEQHGTKFSLWTRYMKPFTFSCNSALQFFVKRMSATTAGIMRGLHLLQSFIVAHFTPLQSFRFCLCAGGASHFFESSINRGSSDSEMFTQRKGAHTRIKETQDFPAVKMPLEMVVPENNSVLGQNSADDLIRDAELARQICSGSKGQVFLDDVIAISVSRFEGHVYNLQTEDGWYIAENLAVHNCRCCLLPVVDTAGLF